MGNPASIYIKRLLLHQVDTFMKAFLASIILISAEPSLEAQSTFYTTYTDPNAWAAAVPGASTVAIPYLGDYTYTAYGTPPGVTYGNVTFSTDAESSPNELVNVSLPGNQAVLAASTPEGPDQDGADDILVSFPSPVTAFGVYYGSWFGGPIWFTFTGTPAYGIGESGTSLYAYPNPDATPDFFGLTTSTPVTSVDIAGVAFGGVTHFLQVSSVSFYPEIVPEPNPMVLCGLGGLALAFHKGFRKRVLKSR